MMARSLAVQAAEKDWRRNTAAVRDQLGADFAYVYRYSPEEKSLQLTAPAINAFDAPFALSAQDRVVSEILLSSQVFSGERARYGEAFSAFQTRYLMIASLRFDRQILGLLAAGQKHAPSPGQLDLFSGQAAQASLFMAIDFLEREKMDLTEQTFALRKKLKSAYQQILEANKLAGLARFAGGLAHEINTPLGAIQMYAEYLQLFLKGKAEEESVEGILKAVNLLRNIVENVRWLSAEGKREFEPIYLKRVAHDTLTLTEPVIGKGLIKVDFDAAANPAVFGNHAALVQVLTNLLVNAKDAILRSRLITRKGVINLVLSEDHDMAVMEVVDNGPGIPEAALGRIFDPFFTTKDIGKGMGLGLSICHSIIEEHGGTIEVASEEGKGTRLSVKLPVVRERQNHGEASRC